MIDAPLPLKLERNICVQNIGCETLVYDEISHRASCLNRTSAAIWWLCDGTRSLPAIAAAASVELQSPVTEELVQYAVAALHRGRLLQHTPLALPLVSRRNIVRTLGVSALAMIPLVGAVRTSAPAQTYTGCVNCSRTS